MSDQDAHLHIQGVSKSFGPIKALRDIELKVERGSFVCLLGPSGCGKTTLLRIIAGFETASSGRLILDGEDISGMPPHKRGFGMVFQSLALFPHMSVAKNIAYGLKLRGVNAAKQRERVDELLEIIELPTIAERAVSALSGGQRQRVAIARALAIQPKLFLLDEPLSALDAKLRDNMQIELRQLQEKFGVTTVLVTHDQHEAMMLADKLVVMKNGEISQVDSPSVVYEKPADLFVADFLGAANILSGTSDADRKLVLLGTANRIQTGKPAGQALNVAVRAENVRLVGSAFAGDLPTGIVKFKRNLGAFTEWFVQIENESIRVRSSADTRFFPETGQRVGIDVDLDSLAIFDAR